MYEFRITERNPLPFLNSTGCECLWVPTSHSLLNVICFPFLSPQEVSVVYESQHSHILLNVIFSPSQSLQFVSVVYEFQFNCTESSLFPDSKCRLQVTTLSHFTECNWLLFSASTVGECHYESKHSHILLNVIGSTSRSLQFVSVVYESQYSYILLSVIFSPSWSLQDVSVVYESSYCLISFMVNTSSRFLQRVSVIYESPRYSYRWSYLIIVRKFTLRHYLYHHSNIDLS